MNGNVQGIEELIAKLQKFGGDIETKAAQEVQATGLDIVAAMVNDAPVDTGNLRQLINSEAAPESDLTAVVSSMADYSDYQEFGTYKMAAHPFFYDNLDAGLNELKSRLETVLQNVTNG